MATENIKNNDPLDLEAIQKSIEENGTEPKQKPVDIESLTQSIGSGQKFWTEGSEEPIGGDLNVEPLNKYDRGLLRGMHQGDVRAANQSNWKAGLNAVVQSVGNIVGDTISGFGYLLELPTVLNGIENTEGEVGNVLTDIGNWIKEQGQEIAPIYASQQAMGFAPGNAEWWAINAPSIASAISLMIPAGATAKGLSLFGRATKISNLIAKAGSKLGIGSLTKLSSQRGITAAITSRHIENLMNSNETYRQVYDEQIAKGIDKEEANRLAAQAAADTYKYGYALLAGDIVQYSSIFGALSKTVDKSKLAKYALGTLGQGATEAGEEGFQYIIDKEAQRKVALEQGLKDSRTFAQRIGDYTKDPEFKTSAAFGAIGGMLFDVIGKKVSKAANLSEDEQEREFYQSIINSPQELQRAEEFVEAALEEPELEDDQRQKLQKKKEDIAFIKQQQKELPDNPEEVQRIFDLRQNETLLDDTQNQINEYRSKLKYSNEQFDKIIYNFQQEWLKDHPDSEAESIPNPDEAKAFESKDGVKVTPKIPVPKNFPYSQQLRNVVRANMQAQDQVLKLLNPPSQEEVKETVNQIEQVQNNQFEFDLTQAKTPSDYNSLINKYPDQQQRINEIKQQKEKEEKQSYPKQYESKEDAVNKLTDFFTDSPFYTERILSENSNLNSIEDIVNDIVNDKFKETKQSPDEILQQFDSASSNEERASIIDQAKKQFGNNSSIVTELNKKQQLAEIEQAKAETLKEFDFTKDDVSSEETQVETDVLYTEGNEYMVRGEPMTYEGETAKFYKFTDSNGNSRRVSKNNTDAIQEINNDEIFDPEQERKETQEPITTTQEEGNQKVTKTTKEGTEGTGKTDIISLTELFNSVKQTGNSIQVAIMKLLERMNVLNNGNLIVGRTEGGQINPAHIRFEDNFINFDFTIDIDLIKKIAQQQNRPYQELLNEIVTHELLHSVTAQAVLLFKHINENLVNGASKGVIKNSINRQYGFNLSISDITRLSKLGSDMSNLMTESMSAIKNAVDSGVEINENDIYGFSDPVEFIVEVLAKPKLTEILNNTTYKGKSLIDQFIDLIAETVEKIVGKDFLEKIGLNRGTLLDQALKQSFLAMNFYNQINPIQESVPSTENFETPLAEQIENELEIEEESFEEPEAQEITETPEDFTRDVADTNVVVEGNDSSYGQTKDMVLYRWIGDDLIELSPSRQTMTSTEAKKAGFQLKSSYNADGPNGYNTLLRDGEPILFDDLDPTIDPDFVRNHVHKYANQDVFFEIPHNAFVKRGWEDVEIFHAIDTPDGVQHLSKLKAYRENDNDPYNTELKKIRQTVYNEWIESNKQPIRSKKLKTKIEAGMSGRFWNTKERTNLPSGAKLAVGVSRSGQKVELSTSDLPTDGIIYEPSNPQAGAVYVLVPTSGIINGKRTYTFARLFTKKLYQVPRLKQQLIDILNKVNDKEDWKKNWKQYLREAQSIVRFKKGENIYPQFNEKLAFPNENKQVQRFYNPDGTFNPDTFIKAYNLDEKIVQIDHNKINKTEEGVPYNETIKDRIGFDLNYNQPTHSPKFKYEPSKPIDETVNEEEDILRDFTDDMDFSFNESSIASEVVFSEEQQKFIDDIPQGEMNPREAINLFKKGASPFLRMFTAKLSSFLSHLGIKIEFVNEDHPEFAAEHLKTAIGFYSLSKNKIYVNKQAIVKSFNHWKGLKNKSKNRDVSNLNSYTTYMLLHETIHSLTRMFTFLSSPESKLSQIKSLAGLTVQEQRMKRELMDKLTPRQLDALNALRNIFDYLKDNTLLHGEYGLTNVDELLAELSNESFVEKLRSIELPRELRFNSGRNIFESIIVAIREFFGLTAKTNNAGDAVFNILSDLIQDADSNYLKAAQDRFSLEVKADSNFRDYNALDINSGLPQGINSYTELKERVDASVYMIEAIYASLRKNDTTTEPLKLYSKIIREGYIERLLPKMIAAKKQKAIENNLEVDLEAYDRFIASLPQLKSYILRALSKKGVIVDQKLITEISVPEDFDQQYEIDGESVIQDDWTGKATLQTSQKEKLSPRLKRWLTTIPVIVDGNVQTDSLGFPKFYSANTTYSVLQRTIGNSINPEHMMQRFYAASDSEFIKNMYDRITGSPLAEEMKTELWNAIGQKVNPLFVTSVEDKMVVSNTQRIENQIQKDIRGAFNPTDSTKSDFEILNKVNAKGQLYWKDSNKPDLTLLKRFKEKYSLAIPDSVINELQKNGKMRKFMDELAFLIESKNNTMNNLVELIKPYYAEGYQSSFLSVEGEPIYGWINASFMGRQINSIKTGLFNKQFYESDPFIRHLTIFKDINNFKNNLDFVIIEGHKEDSNKREGTSFVNMSEKDLFKTLLNTFDSSSKKAIIALPVLSDAGALTGIRVDKLDPQKAGRYITNVINAERARMNYTAQTNHRFKNKHIMFPFIETTDSADQVKGKLEKHLKEEVDKLEQKTQEYGIKVKREKLTEFALNHMAYQAQFIPLLMGDPAYYKDSADFFKRAKEIWSPGSYLNTNNFFTTTDGRIIKFPQSGTYNVVVQRDVEEASDKETVKSIEAIAGKEIADKYRKADTSVTDAQSYIDLYTLRLQYIGQNRWTHEMQKVYDDILLYGKNSVDTSVIFQPNKPFYFGHLKLNDSVYPMQNKDSEMVLTPDYVIRSGNEKFKKIMESMGYVFNSNGTWSFDETGRDGGSYVDKYTFSTSIKTPVHSVIESTNDIDQSKFIEFNWSDWRRQMETPEHHLDADNIFGTQIMKLITADISNEPIYNLKGEKLNGNEIYEKYNKLVIDDIKASLNNVKKRLSDKTNILNAIRQEIVNRNLGQIYLDLLQDIDGETVMPLYHPAILYKVETIVNSIIRSNVTRQKFKRGVALFNASPFGLKKEPKIRFNPDNTIKHIEVYAPVYNKEFMKYYNSETGEYDMSSIPEHLLEGIVYRIPTEDKYSMFKIKVIGLLPPHMGGNIIMPKEVTKIAGLDYDIDKVFGFFYEDVKSELSYALTPEIYSKYQQQINELKEEFKKTKDIGDVDLLELILLQEEILREKDTSYLSILQQSYKRLSDNYPDKKRLSKISNELKEVRIKIKDLYEARNNEALGLLEEGEYEDYKRKIDSDNQKLDIMREILTHSGKSFFNPGGFQTIIDNTNQSDPEEYNINGKKWLPITAPTTEFKIAERINTGRQLIGIAANYNAVHAIFQRHNLKLPRGFRFKNRIYDDLSVVNEIQPDGSKSDKLVTRNISENLAAFVDNGKDPRAEYYNMNEYTADVAFGLLSTGVPLKDVMDLLKQPILKELAKQVKIKGQFGAESYYQEYDGYVTQGLPPEVSQVFSKARNSYDESGDWKSDLKQEEIDMLSDEVIEKLNNANILSDWWQYKSEAKSVADLVSAVKVADAGPGTTFIKNYFKLETVNKENSIEGYESIFEDTYTAEFIKAIPYAQSVFIDQLGFPNIQTGQLKKVLTTIENLTQKTLTEKATEDVFRNYMDYIMSGVYPYDEQLIPDVTKRLSEYKVNNDNTFTNALTVDNELIQLSGIVGLDVFEQEEIRNGWRDLFNTDKQLAIDLAIYSYMLHGFRRTGFTLFQPLEIYEELGVKQFLESTISDLNGSYTIDWDFIDQYMANEGHRSPVLIERAKAPQGEARPVYYRNSKTRSVFRLSKQTGYYELVKQRGKLINVTKENPYGSGKTNNYNFRNQNTTVSNLKHTEVVENDVSDNKNKSSNTINIWSTDNNGFNKLSNFAERKVTTELGTFNTVEGAYQAMKSKYSDQSYNLTPLKKANGFEAKKLSRQIKMNNVKQWDKDKFRIIKDIMKKSFIQNPDAAKLLLSTGNAELTHKGGGNKEWETAFPRILMEIRSELQNYPLVKVKLDTTDKELKSGSIVKYKDKTWMVWRINPNDRVQLIDTDGNKYSGTPMTQTVTDITGSLPVVEYNGTPYIVSTNLNIYSTATGKQVYTGSDSTSEQARKSILNKLKENC